MTQIFHENENHFTSVHVSIRYLYYEHISIPRYLYAKLLSINVVTM